MEGLGLMLPARDHRVRPVPIGLGRCLPAFLLFGVPLSAQGPAAYQPRHLACAAFFEEVRTTVDARRGLESWQERGERRGRLQVRGVGLRFEAWFDSLEVYYVGRAGPVRPGTDGLVGGRWRGALAPHGAATLEERPFMPPDLAAVSDLSDQLLDFFPPLPTAPLRVGGRWSDSLGLEVERLPDSAGAGGRLERYRWRITGGGAPAPLGGDTTVRLRQRVEDEGVVAWSAERGPVAWRREITVEAELGAARGPRSPVRSRVTQRVTVRRVTNGPDCQ